MKLASVASDVLGASGRAMLKAMIGGESDPAVLADMAKRRLRAKIPELRTALHGRVSAHHRFMLKIEFDHLEFIESMIARLDAQVEELMRPFARQLELLKTIPGVKDRTAQNVLAEIGPDMSRFPTAKHLASWAGICPGNNESAGKRKTGRTAKGNRWVRRALTEAGWAAAHTKATYYSAQFRRLASKRGKKRAIVAVAHSVLVAAWHILSGNVPFHELGAEYFDKMNRARLQRYYLRRLTDLGLKVVVSQEAALSDAA